MKYQLLVTLALICTCYAKPLADQVSTVTANPSAPTIITDYSSAAKIETPQEAPTQSSDTLKSTLIAEKVETPLSASAQPEQPLKPKSELKVDKIEPLQDAASSSSPSSPVIVEKREDVAPTISGELNTADSDAKKIPVDTEEKKNVENIAVIPKDKPSQVVNAQDTIRSEETVKQPTPPSSEISASSPDKDSEKKLDQEAVSSEVPKQSNAQVDSVSVDEPKSSELKSDVPVQQPLSTELKSQTEVIGESTKPEKLQNEQTSATDAGKTEKLEATIASQSPSEISKGSEEKTEATKSELIKPPQSSEESSSSEEVKGSSQEQNASPTVNAPKLESSEELKTPAKSEEKPAEIKPQESIKPVAPENKQQPIAPVSLSEETKKSELQPQPQPQQLPEDLKSTVSTQKYTKPSQEAKPSVESTEKQNEASKLETGDRKKVRVYVQKREAAKYDEKKPTETYVKKDDLKKNKNDFKNKPVISTSQSTVASSNVAEEQDIQSASVQSVKESVSKSSETSAEQNNSQVKL